MGHTGFDDKLTRRTALDCAGTLTLFPLGHRHDLSLSSLSFPPALDNEISRPSDTIARHLLLSKLRRMVRSSESFGCISLFAAHLLLSESAF